MPDLAGKGRTRSVVIAVSGFSDLRPMLRQAARFAASLNADLAALLMEDEGLRRMAEFPFFEQVSLATARRVPMQAGDLERELVAFARVAERTIVEVARDAGIKGRVETARGQIAAALRAAVRPGDLVMISTARPLAGIGSRSVAEAAFAELSDCDVLLHDLRPGATSRIAVCDDGSAAARRATETGAALAHAYGSELTVIDVDHGDHGRPLQPGAGHPGASGFGMVQAVLREEAPSILVLPVGLAERIGTIALLQTSGCAVLVVR